MTEMQEREQKLLENLLEREPNQWNFALTWRSGKLRERPRKAAKAKGSCHEYFNFYFSLKDFSQLLHSFFPKILCYWFLLSFALIFFRPLRSYTGAAADRKLGWGWGWGGRSSCSHRCNLWKKKCTSVITWKERKEKGRGKANLAQNVTSKLS